MRLIVQRVTNAKIVIEGEEISTIENGLLVLVGICKDDTIEDMKYCARKVVGIRLFEDEEGKAWTKSAKDLGYEILFQSQFTLFANVSKGNKPDFHKAMSSETSREFYEKFLEVSIDHLLFRSSLFTLINLGGKKFIFLGEN